MKVQNKKRDTYRTVLYDTTINPASCLDFRITIQNPAKQLATPTTRYDPGVVDPAVCSSHFSLEADNRSIQL